MDLEEFKTSLAGDVPAEGVDAPLRALWHLAKGDWDEAHRIAQDQHDAAGAWVHAHLHRVEGDAANAGYWYRRAGKPVPSTPPDAEWDEIAAALLSGRRA